MRIFQLLILLPALTGIAEPNSQIEKLRSTLTSLQTHAEEYAKEHFKSSGGVPELTVVKHQLRDWIESRLDTLKQNGDEEAFQRALNATLKTSELTYKGESESLLGYLGDIKIMRESDLLIVTTSVGIVCQYDQSAYAYQWIENRWKRIWESEQNDYAPEKYLPQEIESIHEYQPYDDVRQRSRSERFILSLGHDLGCSSGWHPVYWRLWRIDSSGTKLLLDRSHMAYFRGAAPYIIGSVGSNQDLKSIKADVLIEFTQGSIDTGVHNREAIRHYEVNGDSLRRVDPVALSPRDFVDEWVESPWSESLEWSLSPTLRKWHDKLHADFGDFSPTLHCQTPDLWQVTITPHNPKEDVEDESDLFFLIRWHPPYHFTMMNVSKTPWPLCKGKDPSADEWRTLFNVQEWR